MPPRVGAKASQGAYSHTHQGVFFSSAFLWIIAVWSQLEVENLAQITVLIVEYSLSNLLQICEGRTSFYFDVGELWAYASKFQW